MRVFESVDELMCRVRELAAEYPERRYRRPDANCQCSYTDSADRRNEGCIFGMAFEFEDDDEVPVHRVAGIDAILIALELPQENPLAHTWCKKVQVSQDTGVAWLECIQRADQWWQREEEELGT